MDKNFNNGYNNPQENNSQDYNQQYNNNQDYSQQYNQQYGQQNNQTYNQQYDQQYGQQNNQYYNQQNGYQEQNNQYDGYNVQPYAYQQNYQEQYNQPYQYNDPYMNGQNYKENGPRGLGIASMVLGICSAALCAVCFWMLAIPAAIIGLILGIISLKKGENARGMAIAGIITSGFALAFAVFMIIVAIIIVANGTIYSSYVIPEFYDYY